MCKLRLARSSGKYLYSQYSEAEAGGSFWVESQPGLQSESQNKHECDGPFLRSQKTTCVGQGDGSVDRSGAYKLGNWTGVDTRANRLRAEN